MRLNDMLLLNKKNYFVVDTGTTDPGNGAWDSTTVMTYTVPDNMRWILICGIVKPSDAATVTVQAFDAADKNLAYLAYAAASTNPCMYPQQTAGIYSAQGGLPLILDGGEYIKITCGAAQGATAYCSCLVLEVPL